MKRLFSSTLIVLAIATLAACSGGPAEPTSPASLDPDAIAISAKDVRFSTDQLAAPADEPFQIAFDNQESVPHNVAIYRDASAAEEVFVPEPFSGPAVETYDVPALTAGTYFFRCDLHPDMAGQLNVG